MVRKPNNVEEIKIKSKDQIYNMLEFDYDFSCKKVSFDFELSLYDEEIKSLIIELVICSIKNGYEPKVRIFNDFKNIQNEEYFRLIDIEYALKENNCQFCFVEDKFEYTLDETINANISCRNFAEYIKGLNASPFEKYLIIYRYVTSFAYNENKNNPEKSRRLIPIFNSHDIVCVGYSKLMNYFCDEAGILCRSQHLEVENQKTKKIGRHQNNIIYLKDEKYGIDGFYYVDACWDSVRKNKEPFLRYLYSLLSLEDVKKFKNKKLSISGKLALLYNDDISDEILINDSNIQFLIEDLGLELSFNYKLPNFLRERIEKGSKFYNATENLSVLMKEMDIRPDFYNIKKHVRIPTVFYPEYLLTKLIIEPQQIDSLMNILTMMKNFQEKGYDSLDCHNYITKYLQADNIENIYQELDKFKSGEFNLDIWAIEKYYRNFLKSKDLREIILSIKRSSIPISEEIFAEALKNSFIVEGYDEKHARVETERAIARTERTAELTFNKESENCFNEKAKERRKQK